MYGYASRFATHTIEMEAGGKVPLIPSQTWVILHAISSPGLVATAELAFDLVDEVGQEALALAFVRRLRCPSVGLIRTVLVDAGIWRRAIRCLCLRARLRCNGRVCFSC